MSGATYVAFALRDRSQQRSTIAVCVSRDGGASWSAPAPVVEAQDGEFYFQPQLAVHTSGRLGVTAFVLREDRVSLVMVASRPRELAFGPPIQVSDEAFDPALGQSGGSKHGAWWIGDYQGLAATPEGFVAVWERREDGRIRVVLGSDRLTAIAGYLSWLPV
jgi:hypothetical protein